MPKPNDFVVAILVMGLLLAIVGMLVYLAQAANIQIVVFQSLIGTLDRVWGIGRAIVYLFVALIACIVVFSYYRELSTELGPRWLGGVLLFSTIGVFLGLLFHYAYVCCDTPVIFYFGFPFSWARGVTNSWHYQPITAPNYLFRNFSEFKWHVVPWNLFVNYVFWFTIGFLVFSITRLRRDLRKQKCEFEL